MLNQEEAENRAIREGWVSKELLLDHEVELRSWEDYCFRMRLTTILDYEDELCATSPSDATMVSAGEMVTESYERNKSLIKSCSDKEYETLVINEASKVANEILIRSA